MIRYVAVMERLTATLARHAVPACQSVSLVSAERILTIVTLLIFFVSIKGNTDPEN